MLKADELKVLHCGFVGLGHFVLIYILDIFRSGGYSQVELVIAGFASELINDSVADKSVVLLECKGELAVGQNELAVLYKLYLFFRGGVRGVCGIACVAFCIFAFVGGRGAVGCDIRAFYTASELREENKVIMIGKKKKL